MNKIYYKENHNRNIHKMPIKSKAKDDILQKQLCINGFSLIELNEEDIYADDEPNINIFSERDILRIQKKATAIEEYYSNKAEDAKNENCFCCLMNNFSPNELLYFCKRKDLLTYLKYCFYFLKKKLFLNNQIYIENRYDLDKCDINYLNGWKFFIPKTVCRACFLQIINMKHLFGNLKTIFTDVDPLSTSRSIHRNRGHFSSRSRNNHSIHRNNNHKNNETKETESNQENNNIIISQNNKIKIKNFKYNSKNNHNISYDDKNGLLSIKKDILGEVGNLVNKKEENEKKTKKHNNKKLVPEYKEEIKAQNDEQTVTEIKIKANEFICEGNLSENYEKEKTINKKNINNNESILKDKLNKNHSIKNVGINSNSIKSNCLNKILINNKNNNINGIESKEEKTNNLNKNKKNMNIYNEILNIRHMSNRIVIKLYFKLNAFKDILLYTIINIGDFKEKLYNSMHFNPEIISYGIDQYDQYFLTLYNEGFKAKKEYEEIFTKIKKESIPSITKNLAKLKEQEKLEDDEKKQLDEMEKLLKELIEKINVIEQKYEETINNFFGNFMCFFNLIKELRAGFGGQIY